MADVQTRIPVKIVDPTTGSNEAQVEALADNHANPTALQVGAFNMAWDGATWDRMPGNATDGILVNLGANNDVTVTGTVTVDTELPAAAALADNTANPTVPAVGAFGMVWDGANWDRQPGTSADGTLVNLGANNDVTVTSGSITADTELPAAVALADNTANPTVPGVGSFLMGWESGATNWDRVAVANSGRLQVDVITGGGSSAAEKVEDAAHTTGDTGMFILGVRNGSAAALTNTEGDYSPIAVNADGAVMVTNDGTLPLLVDTELPTAAALADNTANPTVPAVGGFNMWWDGANWDRAAGNSADGALVNLGANNDVTVTSGSITADTELPAAAALADGASNPTAPAVGAFLMGWNGTTWDRVDTANTGRLQVDVVTGGGSDTPTNPVISYQTSASLAAGSSVALTTAEATSKKLTRVDAWSSVPFKATLHTVDNGSESTVKAIGGNAALQPWQFISPHRNFITLGATAGLDAFRVNVTNLDNNTAADCYAVFYYQD